MNTEGFVGITVKEFANSDLNGDVFAYYYNHTAAEYGLDPWRLIEGVDPRRDGSDFDIWGAADWCKRVGPNFTIYLSAKDAAKREAA